MATFRRIRVSDTDPHYVKSYTYAANHNLPGYVPPGYNKLRTTLLQQEKANVERQLEPIKGTWSEKGVTIVSDGWTDPQRRPIINFMATSGSGPMFLKAMNCFGIVKDKELIAERMKEVIEEVGHQNVVQLITDNASNCKGAGEIIEGLYPNIYWTPCVIHTLNLALRNICAANNVEDNAETYEECHWITEVHGDALQIKNYILNHGMKLDLYNQYNSLKLLSIAETRFASVIVMLKRLTLVRCGLEAMVLSPEWISYRREDQGRSRFVKERVLSEEWWDKINYILDFTRPIYEMIRACDTDKPWLHLVYEMWDDMIEKVKDEIYKHESKSSFESSSFYDVIYKILIARWGKSNTPLHCLAHSLNPRLYSNQWLQQGSGRIPPHRDEEVSDERRKCFRRLYPSDNDYCKVLEEYANFSLISGCFANTDSLGTRYSMEPRSWWANFGAKTPLLQALALKLLGHPTSSSCCERNWSIYSFIHSFKRNKLNPKRVEDLVYLQNNLRLLSRNNDQYNDEKTRMWDVGGDSDAMGETGYLEFAELSLDEPELEGVFFSSD